MAGRAFSGGGDGDARPGGRGISRRSGGPTPPPAPAPATPAPAPSPSSDVSVSQAVASSGPLYDEHFGRIRRRQQHEHIFVDKEEPFVATPRPAGRPIAGRRIAIYANYYPVSITSSQPVFTIFAYIRHAKNVHRAMNATERVQAFWAFVTSTPKLKERRACELAYDGLNTVITTDENILLGLDGDESEAGGGGQSVVYHRRLRLEGDDDAQPYILEFGATEVFSPDLTNPRLPLLRHHNGVVFTTLDFVETVVRQYPGNMLLQKQYYARGCSFYYIPQQPSESLELSECRGVWYGAYFRPAVGIGNQLFLNVDTSSGVFYKDVSVLQYVCEVLNQYTRSSNFRPQDITYDTALPPDYVAVLSKALKGMRVKVVYKDYPSSGTRPRTHVVVGVGSKTARGRQLDDLLDATTFKFSKREGPNRDQVREVSVLDYMAEKYGIEIQFPKLPLLVCRSDTAVPMEFCRIDVPQRSGRDLPEHAAAVMIKQLCMDAVRRKGAVQERLEKGRICDDVFTQHFGVKLASQQMVTLPDARVLPPPSIQLGRNQHCQPQDGVWKVDRNTVLLEPQGVVGYGVIVDANCNLADADVMQACRTLVQAAKAMGARFEHDAPFVPIQHSPGAANFADQLDFIIDEFRRKQTNVSFVLAVMNQRDPLRYGAVKVLADRDRGVPVQCVLKRNLMPLRPMTAANLWLKINAKIGGANWAIVHQPRPADTVMELMRSKALFIGVDVSHPPKALQSTSHSVAVAVGNIDERLTRFTASIRVQKGGKEHVDYMGDLICDRLAAFHRHRADVPDKLIVFRDGVSEVMFDKVVSEEVQSIRRQLQMLGLHPQIPITYVVCQKRHHSRFFCQNAADQSGRAKNVPPGTVVDVGVADPDKFDFFLCSHFGIQGTCRPCHYHVVYDENNFEMEAMERLAYYLTHLYSRCPRSVSIPAPVYYADLVCERARILLHDMPCVGVVRPPVVASRARCSQQAAAASSGSGTASDGMDTGHQRAVTIHANVANNMYFC